MEEEETGLLYTLSLNGDVGFARYLWFQFYNHCFLDSYRRRLFVIPLGEFTSPFEQVTNFLTQIIWLQSQKNIYIFENSLQISYNQNSNVFLCAQYLSDRVEPDLSGLEVSEEFVVETVRSFRKVLEEMVRWMFRVGAESEWFVFARTVLGLWILSRIGNLLHFHTCLFIGT